MKSIIEKLKEIDRITCNAPIMDRDVQKAFAHNPELEDYRVELCKLIISVRELARTGVKELEAISKSQQVCHHGVAFIDYCGECETTMHAQPHFGPIRRG